jgi:Large polyvalent protein-associated domain 7
MAGASLDPSDQSESTPGRRRPATVSPENSVSASRRRRRNLSTQAIPPAEPTSKSATAPSVGSGSKVSEKPENTDPWTVPQSVRDRFVQEGNRFYFPDGAVAFRDGGRRLSTPSVNTEVVGTLIEIARSRGWTEVSLGGTEAFRREAWRQARVAGLEVRGFRPSEQERVQLIRTLARDREDVRDPPKIDSVDAPPLATGVSTKRNARIRGRLLEHGEDFYRHDSKEAVSYFVRLETAEGTREIWGKDIKRAVAQSLSQPKAGDEVILQRVGQERVTVRRPATNEQGQPQAQSHKAFRNRWTLETVDFFEKRAAAAQVFRDETVRAQEAVRQRPELTGTYLDLKAAQLASRTLKDPNDQKRFVERVRLALARDIERGEPLQPVRIRDRGSRLRPRGRPPDDLAPAR